MALSETPKCWEAVVDMEEKVNHCDIELIISAHHAFISSTGRGFVVYS
jgi:hypothetical protein